MSGARRKKEAADILVHYFRQVYEKAGLGWSSDNEVEVRGIVDDLVQAAIEP